MSKNEKYGPFREKYGPYNLTEDMKQFVRNNEKGVRHLYKDINHNITIGYGMRVPDENAVAGLPLYYGDTYVPPLDLPNYSLTGEASPEEKRDAYRQVMARSSGKSSQQRYTRGKK